MTREEVIEMLKKDKEQRGECFISDALNIAIRSLEQELILDKIRFEIELKRKKVSQKHSENEGLTNYYFGLNDAFKDARDILDKYIAESEDKQ